MRTHAICEKTTKNDDGTLEPPGSNKRLWIKTDDFGVGAPPISVNFSGDWDVHWGSGILTHGQIV